MMVARVIGIVGISAIMLVACNGPQSGAVSDGETTEAEIPRRAHSAAGDATDGTGHSYRARRSHEGGLDEAGPTAAGMRIGKMPNQRGGPPSTRAQTSAAESQRETQDVHDAMTARPGVTAAGGVTIELDDRFTTQVEIRPGPASGAECTTSRVPGS